MNALTDASLLDIHTHYRPKGWIATREPGPLVAPLPGSTPEALEDLEALATTSDEAGVALRALSATVESLFGREAKPETSTVNSVNEYLAEAVQGDPDHFLGLGTVDAYSGDDGAEQTRYAIEVLGLHGLVLDSSRYDRYLSAAEAFPTLELAAELGVPVLVHPFAAPQAKHLVEVAGRPGNSVGRGLQNGVSFLSALHADLPARLPDLHLIFTTLGSGAVLFAAEKLAEYRDANGRAANLYFETTRFNAPLLRYLGAIVGPDRLVVGSDWPGRRDANRANVDRTLDAAGFSAEEQERIRIGNARELFELRTKKIGLAA